MWLERLCFLQKEVESKRSLNLFRSNINLQRCFRHDQDGPCVAGAVVVGGSPGGGSKVDCGGHVTGGAQSWLFMTSHQSGEVYHGHDVNFFDSTRFSFIAVPSRNTAIHPTCFSPVWLRVSWSTPPGGEASPRGWTAPSGSPSRARRGGRGRRLHRTRNPKSQGGGGF